MAAATGRLSTASRWTLYVLLVLMVLLVSVVCVWQIEVLSGKRMPNCDGSADDWHEQKTHYGIALADLLVLIPTTLLALGSFVRGRTLYAHYLFSMVAFWFVYTNIFTTATSLRFENPTIDLEWIIVFPFGIALGLAYLVWAVTHFDAVLFQYDNGTVSYTPIPDAAADRPR